MAIRTGSLWREVLGPVFTGHLSGGSWHALETTTSSDVFTAGTASAAEPSLFMFLTVPLMKRHSTFDKIHLSIFLCFQCPVLEIIAQPQGHEDIPCSFLFSALFSNYNLHSTLSCASFRRAAWRLDSHAFHGGSPAFPAPTRRHRVITVLPTVFPVLSFTSP